MPQGDTLLAVDAGGSPLGNNPLLLPGQDLTVTATGFSAGEQAEVTVHSTPRLLGTATASSGGIVTYPFIVPTDLPTGNHTLVLRGATRTSLFAFHLASRSSGAVVSATTAASSGAAATSGSPLPFTGFDTVSLLLIALLFVWAGTLLVLYVGPARSGAGRPTRNGRHSR